MSEDIALGDKLRNLCTTKFEKEFNDKIVPILILVAKRGRTSITFDKKSYPEFYELLETNEKYLEQFAGKNKMKYCRINFPLPAGSNPSTKPEFAGAEFSWN